MMYFGKTTLLFPGAMECIRRNELKKEDEK